MTNPDKGVLDAAFSPDGKQLAVVSNLNDAGPVPALADEAPTTCCMTKAKPLGVTALQGRCGDRTGSRSWWSRPTSCSAAKHGAARPVAGQRPEGDQQQLALRGDNPTFQPLTLGG